jgi:hypothetical protein
LANWDVGNYLNTYFVSSYQKVGTFRVANGQKQGGNVASYFCLPEGQVLHVIAGPVNAATMLTEARWVVETWKMALLEKKEDASLMLAFFRKAHLDRLRQEHGLTLSQCRQLPNASSVDLTSLLNEPASRGLSRQGRVHLLLAKSSPLKIEQIYQLVFERILGETISTSPVVIADTSSRR